MPYLSPDHYVEKVAQVGQPALPLPKLDSITNPTVTADQVLTPPKIDSITNPDVPAEQVLGTPRDVIGPPKGIVPGKRNLSLLATLGILGAGATVLGNRKARPQDYLRNVLLTMGLGYGGYHAYKGYQNYQKNRAARAQAEGTQ